MLDNVQRAAIERALNKLNSSPNYSHKMAIIERVAGKAAAKEVADLTAEYRDANDQAKLHGCAMLSGEAADYWQEAQGVLSYGRLALSMGSRAAEKALSRRCELLEESFAERVPEHEQRKFVIYDVQAEWQNGAEGYDNRWDWTQDFRFPLLSPQFTDSLPVRNPVGEAQRVVLAGLLDPPAPAEQAANVSRLESMLARIADDRSEFEKSVEKRKNAKIQAAARKA